MAKSRSKTLMRDERVGCINGPIKDFPIFGVVVFILTAFAFAVFSLDRPKSLAATALIANYINHPRFFAS